MQTVILEELKAAAKRLFKDLRLTYIFQTLGVKEKIEHLILSEQDKLDIAATIRLQHDYTKEFDKIAKSVTSADIAIMSSRANDHFERILYDETLSLKQKILKCQSRDYMPFIRAYEVPGKWLKGKSPKSILFLNKKPECYTFNAQIVDLIHNLEGFGYGQSIIVSASAMDARVILETGKIHGIFNCDQTSGGPRPSDTLLKSFNIHPTQGTKFNDISFNKHVMSLAVNKEHGILLSFLEELDKLKEATQYTLEFQK